LFPLGPNKLGFGSTSFGLGPNNIREAQDEPLVDVSEV